TPTPLVSGVAGEEEEDTTTDDDDPDTSDPDNRRLRERLEAISDGFPSDFPQAQPDFPQAQPDFPQSGFPCLGPGAISPEGRRDRYEAVIPRMRGKGNAKGGKKPVVRARGKKVVAVDVDADPHHNHNHNHNHNRPPSPRPLASPVAAPLGLSPLRASLLLAELNLLGIERHYGEGGG
ncbi:hypothetical protein ScalyP_jg1616, partial [Parmales sp. scaly parma]